MTDLLQRTATFLFSRIELDASHDHLDLQSLELHARQSMMATEGQLFNQPGAWLCAAFPSAVDALRAAVVLLGAARGGSDDQAGPLPVCVALHTGPAAARDSRYTGPAVDLAQCMIQDARIGQLLLSPATHDLLPDHLLRQLDLRDLGLRRGDACAGAKHDVHVLALEHSSATASTPAWDSVCHHLPVPRTRLIGRTREVAAVRKLIQQSPGRLVTLTGPGGVGKTRLAIQVAAEMCRAFRDGVWFVSLATTHDPEQAVLAIAQALSVREKPNQPLRVGLNDYLHDKQLVLVLDNVEQVAGAAPLLSELLDAPSLRILVTSRRSLQVYGEQEFRVPPLALPNPRQMPPLEHLAENDSVRLFIERAQAVTPDFTLTEEQAALVATICAQLDGLPLAIELAAARIKLLPPATLLTRLSNRLRLLKGGASDLPERQQTLQNTIAWSYDLLSPAEQTLFTHLAVFVGGWSLTAAEEVCGSINGKALDVLDSLSTLMNHSLVYQRDGARGEARFGMLETIREYALELLLRGEMELLQRRHAAYYLAFVKENVQGITGAEATNCREQLETEHDNVRAALRWAIERGDADLALHFSVELIQFWKMYGYHTESDGWLSAALALEGAVGTAIRARVIQGAGVMNLYQKHYDRAFQFTQVALQLYREMHDLSGEILTLNTLGILASEQHEFAQARSYYEKSLAIARTIGDTSSVTNVLNNLGILASEQHEFAQARSYYEECLAIRRAMGDRLGVAYTLNNLGWVAAIKGNFAEAQAWLEESLSISHSLAGTPIIAAVLINLGWLALERDDVPGAAHFFQQSSERYRELDWMWGVEEMLEGLAAVATAQGQAQVAARLLGVADAHRQASGRRVAPSYQPRYDRIVTGTRRRMHPDQFKQAFSAGQAMPLEQALEYAASWDGHSSAAAPTPDPMPLSARAAPPTPSAFADLTRREIEVLRLVARSMSNAEIAETLVISPLTVTVHLRSIYRKLDVSSRAAATRMAIEQQLA